MKKFLKFCGVLLGLDLFADWIVRSYRYGSFLKFFENALFVFLAFVGLHIVGVIALGISDHKFFAEYMNFWANQHNTPAYEMLLGCVMLAIFGIMLLSTAALALFISFVVIVLTIATPFSAWSWCKKKWKEIYRPEEISEDDDDDDERGY